MYTYFLPVRQARQTRRACRGGGTSWTAVHSRPVRRDRCRRLSRNSRAVNLGYASLKFLRTTDWRYRYWQDACTRKPFVAEAGSLSTTPDKDTSPSWIFCPTFCKCGCQPRDAYPTYYQLDHGATGVFQNILSTRYPASLARSWSAPPYSHVAVASTDVIRLLPEGKQKPGDLGEGGLTLVSFPS